MTETNIKVEPDLGGVPEIGTQYFYIRGCMTSHSFRVTETMWIGGMSDIMRLAKGNLYLTQKGANMVCMQLNERMNMIADICGQAKILEERKAEIDKFIEEQRLKVQSRRKYIKKKKTQKDKAEAYDRNKNRIHQDIIDTEESFI